MKKVKSDVGKDGRNVQLQIDLSWIATWFETANWRDIVISEPRMKSDHLAVKIKARLIQRNGGELYVQFESFIGKQVFHENVQWDLSADRMSELMQNYRQARCVWASGRVAQVTISKKGKAFVNDSGANVEVVVDSTPEIATHNRVKPYPIPEGVPVPFLTTLGVMQANGKVTASMYHKFRQLNRYLEFVQDILPALPQGDQPIRIIDFGCGKSYLTFALVHWLHVIQGRNIDVIGLDLREDVIRTATNLVNELGWQEVLRFQKGDIADFEHQGGVDLVVSLHACDTATDFAIAKAVTWGSKVIFAVPCCQHEVAKQLTNVQLSPMLGQGLFKERFCSLWTDSFRVVALEAIGYDTQLVEFIETEHTPKNALIRAVLRTGNTSKNQNAKAQAIQLQASFGVRPTLARLFELNGSDTSE